VRKRYPEVPIIWGGIHASLMPEQTLANPYADIVVVGEGEETFPELVKALELSTPLSDVSGICYKENGEIHRTGDRPFVNLDQQPPLSYHLITMDYYRRRLFGIDHISLNSSRGCTGRCAFCWDPVMHKRKWRAMKADTVLEHMKRLIRRYDFRGFLFTDDNFFVDMNRAHGILEKIVQADLNISISKLQIRADTICRMDRDFFELLVKAKVKRLTIGVESGSQRILDLLKKGISIDKVVEANRKLKSYPIMPLYLFMMGLPTETREELAQSICLAEQLVEENPNAVESFNIYVPYPGTELYELARNCGLQEPQRLEEWARFNFRNIPKEYLWIEPKMRKLIEGLDFSLMLLGKKYFAKSYKKTNPLVVRLSKLYYPIARYRVKHLNAHFPIETKIIKALGLFGRQD
jgi:radical SAM superfamily enzyme YgiQ (UPF0313 family)